MANVRLMCQGSDERVLQPKATTVPFGVYIDGRVTVMAEDGLWITMNNAPGGDKGMLIKTEQAWPALQCYLATQDTPLDHRYLPDEAARRVQAHDWSRGGLLFAWQPHPEYDEDQGLVAGLTPEADLDQGWCWVYEDGGYQEERMRRFFRAHTR